MEEFCVYRGNDVKNAAFLQVNAPLTEKTWRRGRVCFGCALEKWRAFHSFQEEELGEKIAKYMARTGRRQLEGRHLLFEEYLRS